MVHFHHVVLLSASWYCSYCLFLQGTKCKCSRRVDSGCRRIKNGQDTKCHRTGRWNNFHHPFHRSQSYPPILKASVFVTRARGILCKLLLPCTPPPSLQVSPLSGNRCV